ncbi:hypothetical protein ACP70R_024934 [Stipagrostis hirtigluma subsp. patula]
MSMSRALQELMTAVDSGHPVVDVFVDHDSASPGKLAASRSRHSSHGRSRRQSAPVVVAAPPPPISSDASFEFSAVVSYSSASPASMVFSDGQLRAHQFPAVRSSESSQVASPVRSSSAGSAKAGATGSRKRVSFAMDGTADKTAAKAGGAQGKKSGGLMGCMGSACGMTRNEVVEPAKNVNRKVVAA